jgi:RNA polymerase sigma factor (sigma-70 family)
VGDRTGTADGPSFQAVEQDAFGRSCSTDTICLTVLLRYELTDADLDRLLRWLGPDPELAAEKYEAIRQSLIQIFIQRGFSYEAEELTDETINRVARKVKDLAECYVGDPALYFYGVARNLLKEAKRSHQQAAHLVPPPQLEGTDRDDHEALLEALEKCFSALPRKDRYLLTEYYRPTGQSISNAREALAEELGISRPALRVYAQRLRVRLRKSIEKELAERRGG